MRISFKIVPWGQQEVQEPIGKIKLKKAKIDLRAKKASKKKHKELERAGRRAEYDNYKEIE